MYAIIELTAWIDIVLGSLLANIPEENRVQILSQAPDVLPKLVQPLRKRVGNSPGVGLQSPSG